MGTRHLTAVVLDGQFKIAQYGQWDGYPEGQGKTVLQFLKKTMKRRTFEKSLRASRFMTKKEVDALYEKIHSTGLGGCWQSKWPHLSRDMGAGVLEYVQNKPGVHLKDHSAFAGDSLSCEFAYIIDLDNNRLEVYVGFNRTPLKAGDRFFNNPSLEKVEGYEPIRLATKYSLNRLPSVAVMARDVYKAQKRRKE